MPGAMLSAKDTGMSVIDTDSIFRSKLKSRHVQVNFDAWESGSYFKGHPPNTEEMKDKHGFLRRGGFWRQD